MKTKQFNQYNLVDKTINRLHRFHSCHPDKKHTAWHCSHKVGELRGAVRGMKTKQFNQCNFVDKNYQQITQIS